MENYDELSLFHSILRNIGVYTSISFAILAASRYHKDNNNNSHRLGFLLLGLIYILCTIILLLQLIFVYNKDSKESDKIENQWYILPNILLCINVSIFLYILVKIYNGS